MMGRDVHRMDTRNGQTTLPTEKTPSWYRERAKELAKQFSKVDGVYNLSQQEIEQIKASHRKQDQRKTMHEALDKARQKRKEKQEMSD